MEHPVVCGRWSSGVDTLFHSEGESARGAQRKDHGRRPVGLQITMPGETAPLLPGHFCARGVVVQCHLPAGPLRCCVLASAPPRLLELLADPRQCLDRRQEIPGEVEAWYVLVASKVGQVVSVDAVLAKVLGR